LQKNQTVPVLIFFGATASGKTEIASDLFSSDSKKTADGNGLSLSGCAEIISADSIQVYKHLTIGSAAPSDKLRAKLPHHLIAVKDPSQEFSAADFVTEADRLCREIYLRSKLPVLLGGTAFFMKNFMYGLPVTPKADLKVRAMLQNRAKQAGIAVLFEELKKNDPVTAQKLHINDEYRIIRACEVFICSGKPLSAFTIPETFRRGYDFFIVSIERKRTVLYDRIEKRVDKMMNDGLPAEVSSLLAKGFTVRDPALKAIGYKEFFDENGCIKELTRLPEITECIKRNTKHYAKRQETFFKKIPCVKRYNAESEDDTARLFRDIYDFYAKYFVRAEN
jgi:tRNA dimethylallyltransferase